MEQWGRKSIGLGVEKPGFQSWIFSHEMGGYQAFLDYRFCIWKSRLRPEDTSEEQKDDQNNKNMKTENCN